VLASIRKKPTALKGHFRGEKNLGLTKLIDEYKALSSSDKVAQ